MRANRDKVAKAARVELLGNMAMLAGCTNRELAHLAELAYDETVPAGTVLVREGDFEAAAFLVAAGEAEAERAGRVVAAFGPGDVFGELALLTGSARSATVTARTEMVLLVLEPAAFRQALDAHPALAVKVLAAVGQHLAEITEERRARVD
jgi:CRP-like cAMP-binding protein